MNMQNENNRECLNLMEENEIALATLYDIYSERVPSYKAFWHDIANEERGHAVIIKGFFDKLDKEEAFLNKDRFKALAIKISISHIKDKIKQAEEEDISSIEALSISYDIEKSLIERKYFETIESDSIAVKNMLETLKKSTEQHLDMVAKEWEKERQNSIK